MALGGMKAAFVRAPPRDLGVRGASIVWCGLSCLVDLNSDLYRLCGSLHGLDTFFFLILDCLLRSNLSKRSKKH